MQPEKIKVSVVDDHQMFVDGLYSLLENEQEIELVSKAHSGKQLLAKLKQEQPEVLLMDVNLPDINGVELSKKVKELYPDINILALTMYNIRKFVYNMIENGVSGYIVKNTGKQELLDAIHSVADGETYYSQEVKEFFFQQLSNNNSESLLPKLTKREKEILRLIAKEYTTYEIAEQLYLTIDTVETHRKNLLQKLDARNTAGMIKTAMEHNLLE